MVTSGYIISVLNFVSGCSAGSFVTLPWRLKALPCAAQNKPFAVGVSALS